MKRFRDYDPFAWLYANYWGHDYHDQILPVLDKLVLGSLPRRAQILDLCCGDGRLVRKLTRRGYRMTGLDGSELLLAYARQTSPKSEFLLADARSFHLPERFDTVLSTFDSLNHVMSLEELAQVFCNTHACLRPLGLLSVRS